MPAAGDLIEGKYRLVKPIGEGGMATVWEAEHVRLQSRVAVKLIGAPQPGLDSFRARFLEEARAAATVRHRNVIDIIDFGTTDEGIPFMVMELLAGDTLADLIEARAPLPMEETVELGAQILGALGAVHEHGLVHRDLKPENVMFARDTDGSIPKIVDFGISKNVAAEAKGTRRPKTREGLLLGTPQYMSPEQARGLKDLDHRTDIYAAGVILYEMLTGERPFDSENVGDLLLMVLDGDATPIAQLRPGVPRSLTAVVERAMAYEREDRFVDAREMRRALVESLDDKTPLDEEELSPAMAPTVRPPALAVSRSIQTTPDPAKLPTLAVAVDGVSAEARPVESTVEPVAQSVAGSVPEPERPITRPVELPDPEPLPMPQGPARARLIRGLIITAIVVAALAAPEIAKPGLYRSFLEITRRHAGVDPLRGSRSAAAPRGNDGGVSANTDAGYLTMRLRGVPRDATLIINRRRLDPDTLSDLREPDGTIALPVPTRPGPIDLRIRVRGYRDWRMRRWTLNDLDREVRLERYGTRRRH